MADEKAVCAVCGVSSEDVPLIRLTYHGKNAWVCPREMPKLIHNPGTLAGTFPDTGGGETA